MYQQLNQTAVQRIVGDHVHRTVEQIPQGAVFVPVPVQPPLAARINQVALERQFSERMRASAS